MDSSRLVLEVMQMLERQSQMDDIVMHLRENGCSKMDCVEILIEAGIGYPEAKLAVHNSAAWKHVKDRDDQLHNDLEEGFV